MRLIQNSFSLVVLGDWNKLYTQPDWIVDNIFNCNDMEIGVNFSNPVVGVSYKKDDIIIIPAQDKFTFSLSKIDHDSFCNLTKIINNFLKEAKTPVNIAYGFNIEYNDEDTSIFAHVIDSISDSNALLGNNIEISSTEISRTLRINNKILNMMYMIDDSISTIRFNEHHDIQNPLREIKINVDSLNSFINQCNKIVQLLGYELEEEDENE